MLSCIAFFLTRRLCAVSSFYHSRTAFYFSNYSLLAKTYSAFPNHVQRHILFCICLCGELTEVRFVFSKPNVTFCAFQLWVSQGGLGLSIPSLKTKFPRVLSRLRSTAAPFEESHTLMDSEVSWPSSPRAKGGSEPLCPETRSLGVEFRSQSEDINFATDNFANVLLPNKLWLRIRLTDWSLICLLTQL